jgi:N-terminal acetyltransferase B complex catalytic subunit
MGYLEEVSSVLYNGFFVDLFVRVSNKLAQLMYYNLGYTVYRQVRAMDCVNRLQMCPAPFNDYTPGVRQVLGYYSGSGVADEEDAYGTMFVSLLYFSLVLIGSCSRHLTFVFFFVRRHCCRVLDMRKALPRDKKKKSVIPLPAPITPDQLEW